VRVWTGSTSGVQVLARPILAAAIIGALLVACADPTPSPPTELNERIARVRNDVWSNEPSLHSDRPEGRLPQLEAAISKIAARYGEHSVATVQASTETGRMLVIATERYDLALPFIQRSLALSRKVYGNEHRETAYALQDLAVVYAKVNSTKYGFEAEAALREALRIRRALLGEKHAEAAGAKAELARQLLNRWREPDPSGSDLREVEELASAARSVLEPLRGSSDSEIVALRRTLLECALVQKDYPLAAKRAREAIDRSDGAPSWGLFPNSTAEELLTRIQSAHARDPVSDQSLRDNQGSAARSE
jgi:hypothetical protein